MTTGRINQVASVDTLGPRSNTSAEGRFCTSSPGDSPRRPETWQLDGPVAVSPEPNRLDRPTLGTPQPARRSNQRPESGASPRSLGLHSPGRRSPMAAKQNSTVLDNSRHEPNLSRILTCWARARMRAHPRRPIADPIAAPTPTALHRPCVHRISMYRNGMRDQHASVLAASKAQPSTHQTRGLRQGARTSARTGESATDRRRKHRHRHRPAATVLQHRGHNIRRRRSTTGAAGHDKHPFALTISRAMGNCRLPDASPQRPRQLEQLEPAGYNQTLDAEAHSIPLGCILPQSERQSRAVCFRFGTRPPGFDSTSPPGRRCQRSDPVRSASQTIRTAAASRTQQHRTSSRANRKQARSAGVGLHSDQI